MQGLTGTILPPQSPSPQALLNASTFANIKTTVDSINNTVNTIQTKYDSFKT
jgi:hypothetical protein